MARFQSSMIAMLIAGFTAGCAHTTRNTESSRAVRAEKPELTVILTKRFDADDALAALPQFAKKAEMRGCEVRTESAEVDMVVAVCGGKYAIVMARHGSDIMVACNRDTDLEECRELARQIVQSGEPQLIGRFTTSDPTLLPSFKLAMRQLGCDEVESPNDVVTMVCPIGVVSLGFDSNTKEHVMVCAPLNSADCVTPIMKALKLERVSARR